MTKPNLFRSAILLPRLFVAALLLTAPMAAGDWPEWRGPNRDGTSPEKGLPETWSTSGDNLLWKIPVGGRSTPVVFNNRVYLFTSAGANETLQERLLALDMETGKTLWEYKYNVYLSDVPPHRIAWSSPAVDPATGNIYIFGVGGTLAAFSPAGKRLWNRSMNEEFGVVTTHGGRTVSPVIDEDLVIVSGLTSNWGDQARGMHRFFGFDKKTGTLVWSSSPGGSPFDTTWASPIIAVIDGMKMFITGGGDGAVHSLMPRTGTPIWSFPLSKRGINTGVLVDGNNVIVSHSEENLHTSEMGMLAAVDGTQRGEIKQTKWEVAGWQGGASSPILDGDRVYQVDLGANLVAFDSHTGRKLWEEQLGTIQKGSPVFADGKLYLGTESGKFFILRPHADRCEVLDDELLGKEENPDSVLGSPAISNGRVLFSSSTTTYCIGKKAHKSATVYPKLDDGKPAPDAKVAQVLVVPADAVLGPGKSKQFEVRLFDDHGRFLRKADSAEWTLAGLKGTVANGTYTAAADSSFMGGMVKAKVDGVEGVSRVRVIPPLPWDISFDNMAPGRPPAPWISAAGKTEIRDMDGNKVLVKLSDNPFLRRTRVYMGPSDWKDYTTQVDFQATMKRRQMGDVGVLADRYQLTLFGNKQELAIMPWQPETKRTVTKKFPWKADTWYRMKLRVDKTPDGKATARGKVWAAADSEPAEWTIEMADPTPNLEGSPGIYADAPFDIYFDNLKVTPNQ